MNKSIGEPLNYEIPPESPLNGFFDVQTQPCESLLQSGKKTAQLFTALVGSLRAGLFCAFDESGVGFSYPVRDSRLQELAALTWELVGNRVAPFAVSNIPTLHFYADNLGVVCIICPEKWYEMYCADPVMQTGGLFFVGSMAQDYWNGILDKEVAKARAYAHEVQFLLQVQETVKGWTPNKYQQDILEIFPQGLESLTEKFTYPIRKWNGPSA